MGHFHNESIEGEVSNSAGHARFYDGPSKIWREGPATARNESQSCDVQDGIITDVTTSGRRVCITFMAQRLNVGIDFQLVCDPASS